MNVSFFRRIAGLIAALATTAALQGCESVAMVAGGPLIPLLAVANVGKTVYDASTQPTRYYRIPVKDGDFVASKVAEMARAGGKFSKIDTDRGDFDAYFDGVQLSVKLRQDVGSVVARVEHQELSQRNAGQALGKREVEEGFVAFNRTLAAKLAIPASAITQVDSNGKPLAASPQAQPATAAQQPQPPVVAANESPSISDRLGAAWNGLMGNKPKEEPKK